MSAPAIKTIGFIGLGVMGEPMCGHLARRSGKAVLAYDLRNEPLARLAEFGVKGATPEQLARDCEVIIMSLPDGKAMQAVVAQLEPHLKPGQCVVDTSTSSVAATREIGARLTAKGVMFADAPVARTREAAASGKLAIMVGATDETFAHVKDILETMGTDVSHCGPIGCGQVLKILNNMLVFENTHALAEAIAIGRRNGVDPETLLRILATGSGDSFILHNHGMKAMVPEVYPDRAFSVKYSMKDLSYALEMADEAGLKVEGARLAMERLKAADAAGFGDLYHPVVRRLIDPK